MTPLRAFNLNERVTHALDPSSKGMITALVLRSQGYTYRVVWGRDFEEQVHFEEELKSDPEPSAVGFHPS